MLYKKLFLQEDVEPKDEPTVGEEPETPEDKEDENDEEDKEDEE